MNPMTPFMPLLRPRPKPTVSTQRGDTVKLSDDQLAKLIEGICGAVVAALDAPDEPDAPEPAPAEAFVTGMSAAEPPTFDEEPPPGEQLDELVFELDLALLNAEAADDTKRAAMIQKLRSGVGRMPPESLRRMGRQIGLFNPELAFPVPAPGPAEDEEDDETLLRRARQMKFIEKQQARAIASARGNRASGKEGVTAWGQAAGAGDKLR